jgi:hypothetical protein
MTNFFICSLTLYETEPYTISDMKGSMCTVKRPGRELARNASLLKLFKKSSVWFEMDEMEPEPQRPTYAAVAAAATKIVQQPVQVNTPVQLQTPSVSLTGLFATAGTDLDETNADADAEFESAVSEPGQEGEPRHNTPGDQDRVELSSEYDQSETEDRADDLETSLRRSRRSKKPTEFYGSRAAPKAKNKKRKSR